MIPLQEVRDALKDRLSAALPALDVFPPPEAVILRPTLLMGRAEVVKLQEAPAHFVLHTLTLTLTTDPAETSDAPDAAMNDLLAVIEDPTTQWVRYWRDHQAADSKSYDIVIEVHARR